VYQAYAASVNRSQRAQAKPRVPTARNARIASDLAHFQKWTCAHGVLAEVSAIVAAKPVSATVYHNPPPIFDYPRQGGGFRHRCSHQLGEGKKPENGAMTGFSEIRWWIMV
jgi:hypothetical protein